MINPNEARIAGLIGNIQGYCDSIIDNSKESGSVACASRILERVTELRKLVLRDAPVTS